MSPQTISPKDALNRLKEGNKRFLQNKQADRNLLNQVKETANGQHPFALVLGCVDSRVSPELIFDQGIGDIFSLRVAGNVIDEDMLGSMEFACCLAGTRLIVVEGHTRCGAVTGAFKGGQSGNLQKTLDKINPSVALARKNLPASSSDSDIINEASRLNVLHSIEEIKQKSPVLAGLLQEGQIDIVGAMYYVSTGEVAFF